MGPLIFQNVKFQHTLSIFSRRLPSFMRTNNLWLTLRGYKIQFHDICTRAGSPAHRSPGPLHPNNGECATNGRVKYSASGSSSDSAPVDILHFLKHETPEGRQEGDSSPRLLCGKVKEPPRSSEHVETRRRKYKEAKKRMKKKKPLLISLHAETSAVRRSLRSASQR